VAMRCGLVTTCIALAHEGGGSNNITLVAMPVEISLPCLRT